MKLLRYLRDIRVIAAMILLIFAGCASVDTDTRTTPFVLSMKSPTLFEMNGHVVGVSELTKMLKKNNIPRDEPLVIQMSGHVPFETIRQLTQQLATAGYKPFFKSPRHADASVESSPPHDPSMIRMKP